MHVPTLDLPVLPTLLAAPAPGWVETTDVLVVGSGIAGLTAALQLREAGLHVTVVTKVNIDDGSTRWAQGGIAAVLDPLDTPAAHASDTEIAGVGLCDPEAVRVLVEEGPTRLRELIRIGAEFDRNADGSLMLTREGGHRTNRIVHAGGDATGAEVQRALHEAVGRDPWIRLVEHALVLDLLRAPGWGDAPGRACGITLHVLGEGSEDGVGAILARAVVLATGGMGQIFSATTNPAVSTGDGVALALRAGAAVTDLEFVQFHPTALISPADATSVLGAAQQPLVSEALRGEGAHLVDADGKRFMVGQHELAELAPRDVVAKGIHRVLLATGADHVYLDARHLGAEFLNQRFPTIVGLLPGGRHRSGGRPDPGRAGRALRLRWRPYRPARPDLDPRAVRLRRGRLHRGARGEPAGQQLAAGGAGLRPPDRRRHRPRPAAAGRAGTGWGLAGRHRLGGASRRPGPPCNGR